MDKICEECLGYKGECESGHSMTMKVKVEYLYLDLNTCGRCIGTDQILDSVMRVLTPSLQLAGYEVEYHKIEIATAKMARAYQLLSSPTIRVNTQDICASVEENSCGCCSEISGTNVDCRVFKFKGKSYEIPPEEMIAHEILNSVFNKKTQSEITEKAYELPENLSSFFKGKSCTKSFKRGSCC